MVVNVEIRKPDQMTFSGHQVKITSDSPIAYWDYVVDTANERTNTKQEDAFYVMNLSRVLDHYRQWQSLMPHIQTYYAVKANPDPVLLKLLASLDVNFDCASQGEIQTILNLGVSPDRIIYANTVKACNYIKYAQSRNVKLMTFDNEDELLKVKEYFPLANLILRIAILDPTEISKLSTKFGCNARTAGPQLLRQAKDLGLNVVGISFHVGGGSKNPASYAEGISEAKRMFKIGDSLGFKMKILDIGGGYPGFGSQDISLDKIAWVVNASLREHFPEGSGVKVMAEPGRYYSLAAFTLCVNVFARKKCTAKDVKDSESATDTGYMYYVNDGVFGSFNCVPVYKIHPPAVAICKQSNELHWSRVWGPTCDSADCILPETKLPQLNIGDWLVFDFMGSYTKCIATEFNGFHCPETLYVVSQTDGQFLRTLMRKNSESCFNSNLLTATTPTEDFDSGVPSEETTSNEEGSNNEDHQ